MSLNISRRKVDFLINMDSPENENFCEMIRRSCEDDRIDTLPLRDQRAAREVETRRRAQWDGEQALGQASPGMALLVQ